MPDNKTVVVGLSGGVDSSFAAAFLKDQGYDVIGVMLNLWSAPEQEAFNRCCSIDSMSLARRVADVLDIPFYAIDARKEFRESVVQSFLDGYSSGITPNPCLVCNTQVRWKVLLDVAHRMGTGYIATGHYARLKETEYGTQLLRGIDDRKDQSYVLSRLPQNYLAQTILPVGDFEKPQVREMCKQWGLPTASRKDSQDLCFLGEMDYREFLRKYSNTVDDHGDIFGTDGKKYGEHQGLAGYTIGQRKGLRIANAYPLYVVGKDFGKNQLIIGQKEELEKSSLSLRQMRWILPVKADHLLDIKIRVRYSSPMISGKAIFLDNDQIDVSLNEASTEISPGQVGVLYKDEICLGGGIIV